MHGRDGVCEKREAKIGFGLSEAKRRTAISNFAKVDLDRIELFKSSIRAESNFSKVRSCLNRTLAKFDHVGSAKVVVFSNTWTQPVLGQDFTVLWLATLGRGIKRGPDRRIIILIPLPRVASQSAVKS